jgi:hypothetical protein
VFISNLTDESLLLSLINSQELLKFIVVLLKNIDIDNKDLNRDIIECCLNCFSVVVIKISENNELQISLLKLIYDIIPVLKKLEKDFEIVPEIIEKVNHLTEINKDKTNKLDIISEHSEEINKLKTSFEELKAQENTFDKSFMMYEIYKAINSLPNEAVFNLTDVKYFYDRLISQLKNIDSYLWNISAKVLVKLSEICLYNQASKEYIFSLLKEIIFKNIVKNESDSETIQLQSQLLLKLLEVLQKLIKRQKEGCFKFYQNIMSLVLEIFDEYFYNLNPAIVSGCLLVTQA